MDDEQSFNNAERDKQYRIKNKFSWMNPQGKKKDSDDDEPNTSSNDGSSDMDTQFR